MNSKKGVNTMENYELIRGKVLWPTKEVKEGCTIGFLMDPNTLEIEDPERFDKKWFNFSMEDTPENNKKLEEIRKNLKGAEVKFLFDGLGVKDFEVVTIAKKENHSEKSGDWQEDMVSFEDLLNQAHAIFKENLIGIKSEPVRDGQGNPMIDFNKKFAVFKCAIHILMGDKVRIFEAHGDATQENIKGSLIKPHFMRMAETRALARALRWATNNAATALEETENGKLKD